MGWILGHELTHGLDVNGWNFDKYGNEMQWGSNQTLSQFSNRSKCFVEQYNSFVVTENNSTVRNEIVLTIYNIFSNN